MVEVRRRLLLLCVVVSAVALVIPSIFNPEPVKAIPGPANDDFADAVVVPGGTYLAPHTVVPRPVGTGNGTTADVNDADKEVGEPTGFLGDDCSSLNSTIWYRTTAPSDGRYVVDTLRSSAGSDTVIRVYTGTAVNALTLIPAACRGGASCDDDGGLAFGLGLRSYLVFCATAGTTYRIQIGDFFVTPPPIGQTWRTQIRFGQ